MALSPDPSGARSAPAAGGDGLLALVVARAGHRRPRVSRRARTRSDARSTVPPRGSATFTQPAHRTSVLRPRTASPRRSDTVSDSVVGTRSMELAYTPEQEALRQEIRAYFAELMTPEVEAEVAAGRDRRARPASRPSARWAATAGSASAGPRSTAARAAPTSSSSSSSTSRGGSSAPIPFLTINTVGRTIMEYGSEEQKRLLPARRSSPASCTSRSATPSRAPAPTWPRSPPAPTRTATSGGSTARRSTRRCASYADYIWLAARTDPDAPKHKGISIFLVPTTDPGFSYSKISTMVNASTYNTFYDDVRVGDDAIVYGVNRGWDLIINQLNYERVSLGPAGHGGAHLRGGPGLGAGHEAARRPARRRPGVGAAQPRPGPRQARVHQAHQLEGGRARAAPTRPTPAPPRCSAPSSTRRPTAC